MKMSAKDQVHQEFLNSLKQRLNVDDKTIMNLEKRITGNDRSNKNQNSLNASAPDAIKSNHKVQMYSNQDVENQSKRSRDSQQNDRGRSRTSGHSNGGLPQPRQSSNAKNAGAKIDKSKQYLAAGFDRAPSSSGNNDHQAASAVRDRRPATNLALKQFDPIAKRFKATAADTTQKPTTAVGQDSPRQARRISSSSKSQTSEAACQHHVSGKKGSTILTENSHSSPKKNSAISKKQLMNSNQISAVEQQQRQAHRVQDCQQSSQIRAVCCDDQEQLRSHDEQHQKIYNSQQKKDKMIKSAVSASPPTDAAQAVQQQQPQQHINVQSKTAGASANTLVTGGFSGIINGTTASSGNCASAGPSRDQQHTTQHQQQSENNNLNQATATAAAIGSTSNSQGVNLVQTRLTVIDGGLVNSVQSNRSNNNNNLDHHPHEQPAAIRSYNNNCTNNNNTNNHNNTNNNNDSATYSNSQQSNSCGPLLTSNNPTTQQQQLPDAIIEERRQKKRQRKQEKTRKVPQSKVTYQPATGESNGDSAQLGQSSHQPIHQVAQFVPSFQAIGERGGAGGVNKQPLQHSVSMGPMLERSQSHNQIISAANNHNNNQSLAEKRAHIADNTSLIDQQSEASLAHQQQQQLQHHNHHQNHHLRSELEVGMVEQLQKELSETKRQLKEKTIEVEKSTQLFTMFDQQVREMQGLLEQNESLKRLYIDTLIKYLTELEDKNRKERRIFLNEQSIKLGRVSTVRQGSKVVDMWEEGEAIIKLQTRLREIAMEKEEIDKLKKRSKQQGKRNQANNGSGGNGSKMLPPPVPMDAFGRTMTQSGLPLLNENSEFDFEESEFNNIDKNEQREIYQFKQKLFENEEKRIKEQLQMLEKEKSAYLIEYKRIRDEEQSKYCGIHRSKTFTVLNDKYLILSILGKGGFSEVYKAFDLENCREVACKIHHFDDSWSDQVKDDYIKHALRENEIHKELNNRRVVKHYDTVEIDHNSFSTILELCSGPDLYNYLKENRQIVEKEAKLIISQILSGLKYLTDQKQKIIHYDLKPQNIIFHNGEVKITDFGLCKIIEENQDKIELTSQGVGTYWYQAPECFDQSKNPQITQKVDIWSVGVIFYELLFGLKPFGHDKSQMAIVRDQTILNARQVQFPQKPSISDGCKDFIRRCLAYHHQDRYDVYEAYYSPYLRGLSSSGASASTKINTGAK